MKNRKNLFQLYQINFPTISKLSFLAKLVLPDRQMQYVLKMSGVVAEVTWYQKKQPVESSLSVHQKQRPSLKENSRYSPPSDHKLQRERAEGWTGVGVEGSDGEEVAKVRGGEGI